MSEILSRDELFLRRIDELPQALEVNSIDEVVLSQQGVIKKTTVQSLISEINVTQTDLDNLENTIIQGLTSYVAVSTNQNIGGTKTFTGNAAFDNDVLAKKGIQINNTTTQFGGGSGVLGLTNAATVPSANPVNGFVMYSNAGSPTFRDSSGNIGTVINNGSQSLSGQKTFLNPIIASTGTGIQINNTATQFGGGSGVLAGLFHSKNSFERI